MAPGSGHAMKQIPHPVQPAAVIRRSAIAVVIQLLAQMDSLRWTGLDAQPASLAFVPIDAQQTSISFHLLSSRSSWVPHPSRTRHVKCDLNTRAARVGYIPANQFLALEVMRIPHFVSR